MTTDYLGAFGYNEAPAALGEPGGFWQFENYAALTAAYERSSELDQLFTRLGAPTYSHIIWGMDVQGVVILHLLVIATRPIYARQYDLLDQLVAWLNTHEVIVPTLHIAGITRAQLTQLKVGE
jgi:hypothetical protein